MDAAKLRLSCSKGFISDIVDFGIQASFENPELCVRNATGVCANALNPSFNQTLRSCIGNTTCDIKSPRSFVNGNSTTCTHEDAILSVQFFCKQTTSDLFTKRQEASMVSCVAVFSALFFLVMVFYQRRMAIINQKEWDVATVTAGDYTADMKITEHQLRHFRDQLQGNYREDTFGYALKK